MNIVQLTGMKYFTVITSGAPTPSLLSHLTTPWDDRRLGLRNPIWHAGGENFVFSKLIQGVVNSSPNASLPINDSNVTINGERLAIVN